MLRDARSVGEGEMLVGDVCVVGAGPAGISIVDRLAASGLRIVLLEGGGLEPELASQSLYRGDVVGHPYLPLDRCRFRLFGGGSNRWGGWCVPLDPLDFERRDWVPASGWPIGHDALEPFFADAARLVELSSPRFDLDFWRGRLPAPFPLDQEFENVLVQHSPQTNFGERYFDRLAAAPGVSVVLHATVTGFRLEPGSSRVASVDVASDAGRFRVAARAFVLAAGGIENARVLLASRGDRADGLGNERGLVGRFFMEHLHVPAGHIAARAPVDIAFYRRARYADATLRGFISPGAAAQREHRLLACMIGVEVPGYHFGTAFLGWPPELVFPPVKLYLRLRRSPAAPVADWIRTNAEAAFFSRRSAYTRSHARRANRRAEPAEATRLWSLYVRSEQAPNPSSRVLLNGERDRFGVPRVALDWRMTLDDTNSILAWLDRLDGALTRAGIGRVLPPRPGWEQDVIGGPHHIGTTRMAATPAGGVVDANCRVHSVDNLYVAGSSVFATGGYANPTFTILALALRLADHVRASLTRRAPVEISAPQEAVPPARLSAGEAA